MRLYALLSFLGVAASGVAVYVVQDGVTRAEAIDAGLGQCPPIDALCPAWRSLPDGGVQMKRLRVKARDCRALDAGFVLPPAPGGAQWFRVDKCRRAPTDTLAAEGDSADEPFECACRAAGQSCRVRYPDGGIGQAPYGVTLGEGYGFELHPDPSKWDPGCVEKSCDTLATVEGGRVVDHSWPQECPE